MMEIVGTASAVLLSVTFLLSGLSKIRDVGQFKHLLQEIGVGRKAAAILGPAVPMVEILLSLLLVVPFVSAVAAVASAVLVTIFTSVLVKLLIAGRKPDCGCFGSFSRAPISIWTVVRNLGLVALASFILVWPPNLGKLIPSGVFSGERLIGFLIALLIVWSIVLTYVLVHLLRQYGQLLIRLNSDRALSTDEKYGPASGDVLPEFQVRTIEEKYLNRGDLLGDWERAMFFVVSPQCEPCAEVMEKFPVWQSELEDRGVAAYLILSDEQKPQNSYESFGEIARNVLVDDSHELLDALNVRATPSAFVVNNDYRFTEDAVAGLHSIESMLDRAMTGSYLG